MKISEKDIKFYNHKPDAGFNPKRNEAIIKKTIEINERIAKMKRKHYDDALVERTDAVMWYLKHIMHKGDKPVEQYFGKRNLAYLRGQKIKATLQKATGVNHTPVYTLEEI